MKENSIFPDMRWLNMINYPAGVNVTGQWIAVARSGHPFANAEWQEIEVGRFLAGWIEGYAELIASRDANGIGAYESQEPMQQFIVARGEAELVLTANDLKLHFTEGLDWEGDRLHKYGGAIVGVRWPLTTISTVAYARNTLVIESAKPSYARFSANDVVPASKSFGSGKNLRAKHADIASLLTQTIGAAYARKLGHDDAAAEKPMGDYNGIWLTSSDGLQTAIFDQTVTDLVTADGAHAASTATGNAQPSAAGGWFPDPRERADLRWYDGGSWTNWVSRGGATFEDPL